jgi:hypothetical protein
MAIKVSIMTMPSGLQGGTGMHINAVVYRVPEAG